MTATNFAWTPATLTVAPGDSVTFVNGGGTHTFASDSGMGECNLPCTKTFPTEGSFAYHCSIHPGMRGTVKVAVPAVVAIETPTPGETVEGSLAVTGTASHATSTISRVQIQIDAGPRLDAALSGSGTLVSWSLAIDTSTLANGAHNVNAIATTASGATGQEAVSFTVANPSYVDLNMVRVVTQDGYPSTRITMTIENLGNVASGPFTLRTEYLYQGEWRLIKETAETTLAAKGLRVREHAWEPGGFLVGSFALRALADPLDAIDESNEDNNHKSATVAFLHRSVPGVDVRDP